MANMFQRTGPFNTGYSPAQVDKFFDHARRVYEGEDPDQLTGADIRGVAFDLVRRGYTTGSVDAALDRLEAAFTQRRRGDFITQHGQQAWLSEASALARSLYGRLTRPAGERFAPGRRGAPAYDRDDVDELCEQLVEYFDRGHKMSAREVRAWRFRHRKGSAGYDEGSVDAFLDRAVEVMLSVE